MLNNNSFEVLVAEDNPNDQELILRALKKCNLTENLYVAEDGEEALDFVFCRGRFTGRERKWPLKVVFLDLKLPKINGLEVLKAIRENPETSRLPVVIVTSSREVPDIRLAYENGANSYVVKPVEFYNFMEAISKTGHYWSFLNELPV